MPRQDRESKPTMLSVTDGRECIGHIISRGRDGWEAFDAGDRTLGLFRTMQQAAAAIPEIANEERA